MQQKDTLVDFVGVGAVKAATTWLVERLREHPEICVSDPKETSFFISYNFTRGTSWYAKHFSRCTGEKVRGEFSPQYLTHPEVPENIKSVAPNAKIIICLRDPVERFLSAYRFNKATGRHNTPLAVETLTRDFPGDLERGNYYKYLKNYFDIFPREQILVLFAEDMKLDGLTALKKTYQFLGVDDTFVPPNLDRKENVSGEVRALFPSLNRAIYTATRDISRSRMKFLVPLFRLFGLHILSRYVRALNQRVGPKMKTEVVDESVRNALREYYHDDSVMLATLLNTKLPWQ